MDPNRIGRNITSKQMGQERRVHWLARLPDDTQKGKCGSCHSYISDAGIQSHGHTCEVCGSVTYYEIDDTSIVQFTFTGTIYPELLMKAKRWDTKKGYLYLHFQFLKGKCNVVTGDRAIKYLNAHKSRWNLVEEEGLLLLKVRYPLRWSRETSAIEPIEIIGHYWNHQIIKVWQGQEYSELANLPVAEMFSIFEAWHHPADLSLPLQAFGRDH